MNCAEKRKIKQQQKIMKQAFEPPEKKARTEEVPYVLLLFQDNKYFFMHPGRWHIILSHVFTRASALGPGWSTSLLPELLFARRGSAASAIWGPLGPLPPPHAGMVITCFTESK